MLENALDQMQRYTADETFKYVQDMLAAHRENSVLLAAFDGVPESSI